MLVVTSHTFDVRMKLKIEIFTIRTYFAHGTKLKTLVVLSGVDLAFGGRAGVKKCILKNHLFFFAISKITTTIPAS